MKRACALSVICLLTVSACKSFLPAHSSSNMRQGERVSIEMLEKGDITDELKADYVAVFGAPPPTPESALASITVTAAEVAFDFVKDLLEDEASLYEAQFKTSIAKDDFWKYEEGRVVARYHGFTIERTVEGRQAFELVCGIGTSKDGKLLRIVPLQFHTKLAKAKVLSDEWGWWFFPPALVGRLFKTSGHKVDTTVAIEVDAYWINDEDELEVRKVAALTFEFPGNDLAGKKWRASEDEKGRNRAGFLGAIPISKGVTLGSEIQGSGAFTLSVVVTEKDPSNAKQYLEKAAELVEERKTTLIERIEGS